MQYIPCHAMLVGNTWTIERSLVHSYGNYRDIFSTVFAEIMRGERTGCNWRGCRLLYSLEFLHERHAGPFRFLHKRPQSVRYLAFIYFNNYRSIRKLRLNTNLQLKSCKPILEYPAFRRFSISTTLHEYFTDHILFYSIARISYDSMKNYFMLKLSN